MQRLTILALCAVAALAVVWLLVRSNESSEAGAPAANVAVERADGAAPGGRAPAGASPSTSGSPSGSSAAAPGAASLAGASGAADAPATATGSPGESSGTAVPAGGGGPGATAGVGRAHDPSRPIAATDGLRPGDPSSPADPLLPSPNDAAPPTDEAEPDAKDPTPENPTEGQPISEDQARAIAEGKVPNDGTLTPEKRNELVEDLTGQIVTKSKTAFGLAAPPYVEPEPPQAP
jgi:hypothetical protein